MRLKLAARSNTQRTDYPSVWGMERCGILSSSDTSWKAVMHGPECHSDSDRIILQPDTDHRKGKCVQDGHQASECAAVDERIAPNVIVGYY